MKTLKRLPILSAAGVLCWALASDPAPASAATVAVHAAAPSSCVTKSHTSSGVWNITQTWTMTNKCSGTQRLRFHVATTGVVGGSWTACKSVARGKNTTYKYTFNVLLGSRHRVDGHGTC